MLQDEKPTKLKEARGRYNDDEKAVQQRTVFKNVPDTQGGSATTAVFNIRLYNRSELKGKASVFSTRGGVLRDKEFSIRKAEMQTGGK